MKTVAEHESLADHSHFGRYLRRIREDRKLSLDAVEEMSVGLPEQVTKSHLSRIENGRAVPTFPRMFSLSQIYGVPIASMAERFELDLTRSMFSSAAVTQPEDDLLADSERLIEAGRYTEALILFDMLLDRYRSADTRDERRMIQVGIERIKCLVHLSRFGLAKEECEDLLGHDPMQPRQRVTILQYFAMCCYRLGKFTFALMVLDRVEGEIAGLEQPDRPLAFLEMLKGNLHFVTGCFHEARASYTIAAQQFDKLKIPFESCIATQNLAATLIELGEYSKARRYLKKGRQIAEQQGYDRLLALAMSHLALVSFKEDDLDSAEALCLRSNSIARPREYASVVFRNCYYLWRICQVKNDSAGTRTNERSLRTYLTRVEDFLPEAQAYRDHLSRGDA